MHCATPHTAPPAAPDGVYGLCLLHADYHPMRADCRAVLDQWHATHRHLDPAQARDCYAAETEQRMLDEHIRQHLRR